jgi:hypothetical protein
MTSLALLQRGIATPLLVRSCVGYSVVVAHA